MPATAAPAKGYDLAVIGAGVVGCALARRFTLAGARVIVLEKAVDVLDGASKGNSGLLHSGFDAPAGSLELSCIRAGYREYREIHHRLGLPLLETGALVVAWNDADDARLDQIQTQAAANGIDDTRRLSARELRAREPRLAGTAVAALRVPGEAVIDPWSAPHAYLLQALANGAELRRGCELHGGRFDGARWRLRTARGEIIAGAVIASAGLYGDSVDRALLGASGFTIRPRKGQFLVFDKPASRLIDAIVLPVPSAKTKGVVLCKTIYGNLLLGPTAEDQQSRDDTSVDRAALEALYRQGVAMLPALRGQTVTAIYAGLRPATDDKDYQIRVCPERRYISVGGIRSTGLSAALGIAEHVYRRYAGLGDIEHSPLDAARCVWPQVENLAEHRLRDWSRPGNGGVVCHCELVTRREIEQAMTGPLAAASLAGLKRRTRVTMGRCQGFYCTGALAEITAGRFAVPVDAENTASDRRP